MSLLLRLLAALALVLATTTATPAAASADQGLTGLSMGALAGAKARIQALRVDLAEAPQEARRLAASTRSALMSGTGVRAVTYLAVLLFVGIGVEWLYWTYAYASLRAVRSVRAGSPGEALRLALRRYGMQLAGLALFGLATVGVSAAFSWPAGVHELVVGATLLLLALRLAWITVAVVVAPGRAHLRLVPVDPGRSGWLALAVIAIACLLALGYFVPQVLERTAEARHVAGAIRLAAATAAMLLLVVAAFAFFGRAAPAATAEAPRAPRFPRSFVLALMAVAVYAVWLMSATAAAIAAILAIVIALQLGLREMVFFFWPDQEEDPGALPSIVLSAARFIVALVGAGACIVALDTPLAALAAAESPWVRVGLRLLGVAVLALLAHVLWIGAKTVIDERLNRIRPLDAHAPDENARLLTLLPLMRVTTGVVLFVMLVLTSLWALGIEITPLLAGAGVVGLALGFGAQALVRDIIAGIFYLAEDAFRIGEYIESGTQVKGTVERITLRSVALRHHNGPLNFVPYGSLGVVRNTSRDWVIDKFNLPLPIDVDSEKIRKMIKKVGEEMKEDPVLGPMIIESLKGKLYRVDPGVKLFRCKFRSPPAKQFDIRAGALKRIEAALRQMGVGFADSRQTLVMQAPPAPSSGS